MIMISKFIHIAIKSTEVNGLPMKLSMGMLITKSAENKMN